MSEPAVPPIVSRDDFDRACADLLVREKAHTRAADALAAARRRLPMVRMEEVSVLGADGEIPLRDVFAGRRMLIVYHFMWKVGAPHEKQCEGCTHSQAAMSAETMWQGVRLLRNTDNEVSVPTQGRIRSLVH